jgi:outer membrane protein assembly factor BamB
VAGDFIYVLSSNGELICLTRDEGRVRWVQTLPLFEDEQEREGLITWSGPVLIGDRLVVTGTSGDAISLSPYTGDALGRIDLGAGTHLAPTIANGTMYVLSDDGQLTAYR